MAIACERLRACTRCAPRSSALDLLLQPYLLMRFFSHRHRALLHHVLCWRTEIGAVVSCGVRMLSRRLPRESGRRDVSARPRPDGHLSAAKMEKPEPPHVSAPFVGKAPVLSFERGVHEGALWARVGSTDESPFSPMADSFRPAMSSHSFCTRHSYHCISRAFTKCRLKFGLLTSMPFVLSALATCALSAVFFLFRRRFPKRCGSSG